MSDFVGLSIALPKSAQRHLDSVGEIICSWLELCQSPKYAQRHQAGRSAAKSAIPCSHWWWYKLLAVSQKQTFYVKSCYMFLFVLFFVFKLWSHLNKPIIQNKQQSNNIFQAFIYPWCILCCINLTVGKDDTAKWQSRCSLHHILVKHTRSV